MWNWILFSIIAVCSYFFGNVNFAIIISKIKKSDIRKLGSGNPGTLNMSRNFGLLTGILTLLLDAIKGAIPCLVGFFVFKNAYVDGTSFLLADLAKYFFGLCVVLGHIFPVFYKFKGGKGIASTIGVLLACSCTEGVAWAFIAIMAIVAAIIFIYVTEFGAMGSFIAITPPAVANSIRMFMSYYQFSTSSTEFILYVITVLVLLLICFFTWFAHRKNIERMLSGEEHATSIKEMIVRFKNNCQTRKKAKNNQLND